MKIIRSYKKIVNEIINLQIPFRIEIIGYVTYNKMTYPLLLLKNTTRNAKKTIVFLSGHHGDEPFAIHTLIKWIKQFKSEEYFDFNIFIYPICNPFGYATGSRDNGANQDTNDDINFVKDSKVKELAILYDNFPVNVDLILDIHGDIRKEAVHMYEHKADNLPSIATQALIENDHLIPYLKQKTIDKIKIKNGVITPPPQDIGIEGALEKLGIEYTMTLELPGKFDGQKRSIGGVSIINSILNHFKKLNNEKI